jgi:serine/threonine protein phosphatase 1
VGKTFVLGDIHGAHRALKQCLERSSFDYENDTLICLGDVADGWPDTKAAVEELLTIRNLVYLTGNHDIWARQWMETGEALEIWLDQGGRATCESYKDGIPPSHLRLFKDARDYYIDNNRLFVHAGILAGHTAEECSTQILFWDRSLVRTAVNLEKRNEAHQLTPYTEVYVGHTPISFPHPKKYCEVWMVDTGAAWSGVLSIMNIDTKEYFTSDIVKELYKGIKGR